MAPPYMLTAVRLCAPCLFAIFLRALVVLLLDALALLLLSVILPGFMLDGAGTALGVAAVVGLLNALVWPLFARFALPITVMTLGLAAFTLNGAFIVLATEWSPERASTACSRQSSSPSA